MRKFTIFTQCAKYGGIHEYKVTARSKKALKERFKKSCDKLIAIESGWGDMAAFVTRLLTIDPTRDSLTDHSNCQSIAQRCCSVFARYSNEDDL